MFTERTLSFLRRLRRSNDRDWFRAHRDEYDADVRAPMLALIEQVGLALPAFAPDLHASPKVSLYRIHRDTRFSHDKSPYKTHVAAIFPHRSLTKHGGAGLYVEVSADRVLIGGGLFAPAPQELAWIRNRLAVDHHTFRRIVHARPFRRTFGRLTGASLQRVPRGFPSDHAAAEFLKMKQFLAGRIDAPERATRSRFGHHVVSRFRLLAPMILFLNEAILDGQASIADPLLS